MITGPEAWLGREMERSTEWIRSLSPRAITELDAAIDGLKQRGLAWPHFGRSDFPPPTFSRDLSSVLHELEEGRGFVLLRGIPVDRYTEGELKSLYWGLGAHLGAARYQNVQGELIGEVRDENRLYGEVKEMSMDAKLGRSSRSKARSSGPLRFHTDRCDVVSLLCVRKARAGGLSRIVSAASVSNTILARRPDLHAALYQDYWRSRQGEEAGGEHKTFAMPVFAVHEGKLTTQYSRTFVEAAQKLPGVPVSPPPRRRRWTCTPPSARSSPSPWNCSPATSSSSTTTSSITRVRRTRMTMDPTATGCSCVCGWRRRTVAPCRRVSRCSGALRRPGRPVAASRSRPSGSARGTAFSDAVPSTVNGDRRRTCDACLSA